MLTQPIILLIYVVVIFVVYVLITGMIYNPEHMAIDAVIGMKKKYLNDENYGNVMDRTKTYYQAKNTKIMIWKGLIMATIIVTMIYFLPIDMTKINIPGLETPQAPVPQKVVDDFIKIY